MKIYKVGGCVRDFILGKEPHDVDYVVVGSTVEEMLSLGYKQVGNDFPVFLHPETGEEYALARKEVKTGDKHTDFKFEFGPDITLKSDLKRRDITINSLAMDIETHAIYDYFNGLTDLVNKTIRHTSEHFKEDPLRVLRVVRFASMLQFEIAPQTKQLLIDMVREGCLKHLTVERVWKEIEKALHSPYFYTFIEQLDEIHALKEIFPEVYALKQVPENLEYHPEGNTYKHLLLTLNNVIHEFSPFDIYDDRIDKHDMALVNFGLLCHDLGKGVTPKDILPAHHGHDEAGIDLVKQLCNRLNVPNEYREYALLACKHHMKFYQILKSHKRVHYDFVKEITNFKNYKKLAFLYIVHKCDLCGREGKIAWERISNMWDTFKCLNQVYDIMEGVTLKDLPKETQEHLSRFKGEKFGKLFRDAKISYLKHNLKEKNNVTKSN